MTNQVPLRDATFSDLGLSLKLLARLEQLKFTIPTPIQRQVIPLAAEGKDVIGIAQTGTGKTLAFALPMLQQISRTKKTGLIILPTRELALQVEEQLAHIGQSFGLRLALLIGGASLVRQLSQIRRRPHIVVGTPGRIIDHLKQKSLRLDQVGVLVLDEADRMLDMGFAPQIKQILGQVPKNRQTMLFSATMPAEIVKIASSHMQSPLRVEAARSGTVAERVDQELLVVPREQKNRLLDKLLGEHAGTVLVFSRTKHGARKICRSVRDMGHNAAEIHSNLSLSQRRKSLAGFKSGAYRILVATDIAARGIDVTNIELVVNYDMPDKPNDYVHRVGRTGRAGRAGRAISFVTPDQRDKIRLIERLVRQKLRVSPAPHLKAGAWETSAQSHRDRESYSNDRRFSRPRRGRRPHGFSHHQTRRTHSSSRAARIH